MSSPLQVTLGIRGREFAEFESLVTTPQLTAYGLCDLKVRSHRALERPHVRIHSIHSSVQRCFNLRVPKLYLALVYIHIKL